jgi:hypothetical protein
LNVVASFIVSILIGLSLVLMTTTVFPKIDIKVLALILAGVLVLGYLIAGGVFARLRRRRRLSMAGARVAEPARVAAPARAVRRETWRMPRLSLLERPTWSRGRMISMYALRSYLVVAVLLLFVKAVQLGLHK